MRNGEKKKIMLQRYHQKYDKENDKRMLIFKIECDRPPWIWDLFIFKD